MLFEQNVILCNKVPCSALLSEQQCGGRRGLAGWQKEVELSPSYPSYPSSLLILNIISIIPHLLHLHHLHHLHHTLLYLLCLYHIHCRYNLHHTPLEEGLLIVIISGIFSFSLRILHPHLHHTCLSSSSPSSSPESSSSPSSSASPSTSTSDRAAAGRVCYFIDKRPTFHRGACHQSSGQLEPC